MQMNPASTPEENLAAMGLALPQLPAPAAIMFPPSKPAAFYTCPE